MNTGRIIKAGTDKCQQCGKVAELRPYGPGGSFICFECGMEDPKATEAAFGALIAGNTVIDARTPKASGPSVITREGAADE